ncbi:MAG: actin-binding WH2 domain-containing protein [Cyanobacteria bacterium CRU_2_1]|nr:actin-binding WH2 domain-containing protein [Cyanobacteria bacterium RU_5_0]NJR61664.1 actin-binding WH2 domain-containing protein [Cyanobacteria bacterium CRU_2_1]
MKHFAILITLLRDRKNFLEDIRKNVRVESKIVALLISSSIFFAVYGAIIGSSSSFLQAISSAIKLPALYLITLIICLPTLFFFDILFGSALGFSQYAALILATMSIISVLLFSFAPITLFFLISVHDYNFFLLLNVAIFTLTGIIGINLFYQGMQLIAQTSEVKAIDMAQKEKEIIPIDEFYPITDPLAKPEEGLQKTRTRLLQFWLILYGLVGSQLGWTLRPFFGAPNEPFQLFRNIEGNFYTQVFRTLLSFLGFDQ